MNAERLDKKLSELIGDTGTKAPGLGVILYEGGREVYANFFGRRVLGERAKPVTRRTRFRVASVSKMFTVFALMQLVEDGKISLEDEAGDLLGIELRNPNQPNEKISVRMLASHTSSLRDGKIYSLPPEFSIAELFRPDGAFWEDGKHFAPPAEKVGEFFTYSNLNYGLLGTIIERVTGKRFDVYQRENLFQQLDMKAEYLPANFPVEEIEELGTLYRKKNPQGHWDEFGDWYAQLDDFGDSQPAKDTVTLQNPYAENFQGVCRVKDYRIGTNATFFSPQGGLRISFAELGHVLEMLTNNGIFRGRKILRVDSLEEMFRPQWTFNELKANGDTCDGAFLSYGLGTYRVDRLNLFGHGGEAFGLTSGLFVNPKTKSGVAYMLNGQAFSPEDVRSKGKSGGFLVWEEKIFDALGNVRRIIEFY